MGWGGSGLPGQQSTVAAGACRGQVGQTSGRKDPGMVKPWPWASKLCHTQLSPPFCALFSVFCFWAEADQFLSLKAQDEQLLLTQALEVIILVPLRGTKKDHLGKKKQPKNSSSSSGPVISQLFQLTRTGCLTEI